MKKMLPIGLFMFLFLAGLPVMAQTSPQKTPAERAAVWETDLTHLAQARPELIKKEGLWCLLMSELRNPVTGTAVSNQWKPVCAEETPNHKGFVYFGVVQWPIPTKIEMHLFKNRPQSMSTNAKYERKNLANATARKEVSISYWEASATIPSENNEDASLTFMTRTADGDEFFLDFEGGQTDTEEFVTATKTLTCQTARLPFSQPQWCVAKFGW